MNIKKDSLKKVAIVIPTYNEEKNIKKLLTEIFKRLPTAYVIVVDDSPSDKTIIQANTLKTRHKRLLVISRKGKGGRGSAVIYGFRAAMKSFDPDVFIEMDADLSHRPIELIRILRVCKEGRIVVASRYLKNSKILNWPLERRIASRISNLLVKAILNIPLKDNTNGYRAYPKSAMKELFKTTFISSGHILLSEAAYTLMNKGYEFKEVHSTFPNRREGRSNASIFEFIDALLDLFKIRFNKK